MWDGLKPQECGVKQIITIDKALYLIQVGIGGHPPFPTSSKQFYANFGNLLFLAVFNFWGQFEGLNDVFFHDQEP
jgi:hypothetical protein